MTETTTATVSPWPIAEETLASCPHLAWLWQDSPARPPTEAELKAYADRRDDPDDILCDATARAMAARRPLRPAVAAEDEPCPPPPGCACSACVPREPGIGDLDPGQQEALDAFNEYHDAEQLRTATTVMPAIDAESTDLIQAVEGDSCHE